MSSEINKRNKASRETMKTLAQHLNTKELERVLDNGWTVAVMFAHLAFWDKQRHELLKDWQTNGVSDASYNPDVFNAALLPFWEGLEPRLAVQLALEHAEAIDTFIESLSEAFIKTIRALPNPPDLERANHRLHHLKQLKK
jgi:hypothetical protein